MLLPLSDVAKYSSLWKDSFVMKHKSYDQSRGKVPPITVMKTYEQTGWSFDSSLENEKWNLPIPILEKTFALSSPKNKNLLKMCLTSSHLRCKCVYFFFGTDLEKFICSEWVPSEWEFKQLKHHKAIDSTPVHKITSCEAKSCMFVTYKSIINDINFKSLFLAKIWVLYPWFAFSSKKKNKVILSESGEKHAQIKYCLQVKTVQKPSK